MGSAAFVEWKQACIEIGSLKYLMKENQNKKDYALNAQAEGRLFV